MGCMGSKKNPDDRGRCGRGTMAPINLGQNENEQISLEEYLKKQQEKDLNNGETDRNADGTAKGFAV